MTLLARMRSFLAAIPGWRRLEREMEEEWQAHIDARADALVEIGVSPDEAARRARLEFGDPLRWKEESREARGLRWLQDVTGDLRYGLRQLRRTPVVSLVAIATLALGIGANTAIFSLVNNLLLRPMPVRNPHELVIISVPSVLNDAMLPPEVRSQFSYMWQYAMWEEIRQTQFFAGVLAYFPERFDLSHGGRTDFVSGLWASGSFFDVLGVSPFLGRTFTQADDRRSGGPDGPVAVISYELWQRRFGGVVDAIGQALEADRRRYTIVGILPRGFFGPVAGRATDVVIPVGLHELASRDTPQNWLTIMGRLKRGDTRERASAELRSLQASLERNVRNLHLKNPLILLPAASGNRLVLVRYERPLFMMLGVVALVLLIICANIGNLLLARGAARQHEMSIRSAIGCSRWRLARQVLVESLLLASLGAASGFWLAWWGGPLLANLLTARTNAVFIDFSPDSRIMAFTAIVSMLSALVFGSMPALRASHVEPIEALIERAGISASRRRLAHGFVVAQVALSLVLVVGAGLFGRSFSKIVRRDLGFDAQGVMVVNVTTPRVAPGQPRRTIDFEDLRRTVAALPGVDEVALSFFIPIGAGGAIIPVTVVGLPPFASGENGTLINAIGPGWFSAYRTPLLAGRDFTAADGNRSLAIVNQAFARRFLNGANPVGRIVRRPDTGPSPLASEWEIVGMTADAVHESLHAPALPMLSFQFADKNNPLDSAFLNIRTDRVSASTLAPAITRAIAARDPDLSLTFQSMTDVVSGSIAQDRALAILIGFFGGLALVLAALGLYGVTAYAVSQRRAEIAIRMALGADRVGVIRLVLSRVALLVGAGIVVGAAASVWMSRFAAPLLYDLEPRDPITLILSTLTLGAVGTFAGWLPAHRASRIDPADALRQL